MKIVLFFHIIVAKNSILAHLLLEVREIVPPPPVEGGPVESVEDGEEAGEHDEEGQVRLAVVVLPEVVVDGGVLVLSHGGHGVGGWASIPAVAIVTLKSKK